MENVVPGGTSILDGDQERRGERGQGDLLEGRQGAEGADVGVIVIGETPYAEFQGDRADLSLTKEDIAARWPT